MGTPGSFPLYDYSLDPFTEECINPYSGGSDTWQMEFNVSKCPIMQATNKKSKTDFPYKMKGETLQKVYHVMVNRHSDEVVDYLVHECYI
jgi:hypothetical protein